MKPISDFAETGAIKSVTVALTGDGRTEANILKAMAERHNGRKHALKLPEPMALLGHGNKKTGRMSGYSALRAIQTYVTRFGFTKFLFLLDVEHVDNPKNLSFEMTQALTALGFNAPNIKTLTDQAYLACCSLGSHAVFIHVVVCGKEKCIEENIASLIRLERGIEVSPNEHDVHVFLKQNGIDLYGLIKVSKLNNLKVAFKDLIAVFENMEKLYDKKA